MGKCDDAFCRDVQADDCIVFDTTSRDASLLAQIAHRGHRTKQQPLDFARGQAVDFIRRPHAMAVRGWCHRSPKASVASSSFRGSRRTSPTPPACSAGTLPGKPPPIRRALCCRDWAARQSIRANTSTTGRKLDLTICSASSSSSVRSDSTPRQQKRPGRNRTDLPHHRQSTSASTSVVKSISTMRRCEQRISALISNANEDLLAVNCVPNKSQPEIMRPASRWLARRRRPDRLPDPDPDHRPPSSEPVPSQDGDVHAVTSWTKDELKQMPEHRD